MILFHFYFQTKMYKSVAQKLQFLYKPYALAIVSIGYVLGELGHYLIGEYLKYLNKIIFCK